MRDGIICIDKPAEHTSFDVIARVRGILHMKKVGHAGTLDPMTTGVLPVFLGRATKACDILPVQDKRYRARSSWASPPIPRTVPAPCWNAGKSG